MVRKSTDRLKTTGEWKIRLRCLDCLKWESQYYQQDEKPVVTPKRASNGRPWYVDR